MNLAEQYMAQESWRDWESRLQSLPIKPGSWVIDLGCGSGGVSTHLIKRGAEVIGIDHNRTSISQDPELAFDGPASTEIIDAWKHRFERLQGLQRFFGTEKATMIKDAFIETLKRDDHRSTARIYTVQALVPEA